MTWLIKYIHKIKCKTDNLKLQHYINKSVKQGYITPNGYPLKCHCCNSHNLENCDKYHEEHLVIEYNRRCKDCKTIVGHWAYGHWDI
jgi:hypothetical protein